MNYSFTVKAEEYQTISDLSNKNFGMWAEDYATNYLLQLGYKILERNWRYSNVGELDIIALEPSGMLVFGEVKARRSIKRGTPFEAVNAKKYNQIRKIVREYLKSRNEKDAVYYPDIRVDVIAISMIDGQVKLKHVKNIREWT